MAINWFCQNANAAGKAGSKKKEKKKKMKMPDNEDFMRRKGR